MNQKRYGRRQSWPLLRYYPGIYLKGVRKMIKILIRIAGLAS
jgi:hypothetical protein